MALSQFTYDNLPEECNQQYLESILYTDGTIAFAKVAEIGNFVHLRYVSEKGFGIYGEALKIRCIAENGTNFNVEDFVIGFDNTSYVSPHTMYNEQCCSSYRILNELAQWLTIAHVTMKNNLIQQSTPYVFTTDANTRKSMEVLANQLHNQVPFISMNKKYFDGIEPVKALSLGVPFLTKDLQDAIDWFWDMAMSVLGIGATKTKKERMLNAEIEADTMEDKVSSIVRLAPRLRFVDEINKKFGLNIKVRLTKNIEEVVSELKPTIVEAEKVGESNVDIQP